ncbi:MAG: molybdopterin-synthase adenylyltransferase MoeB [Anaerolineae bacterium]|jgi:adenylyltransferase/sulfurtransferase
MLEFTEEQIRRYSRQIILPHVGGRGQRRLLSSKVLIVGVGGLGSPAALYLAAAGVGTLGIVDSDVVDLSNLHRQVIHRTKDVGRPKTASTAETLRALNPDVELTLHQERLTSENVLEILEPYDVVVEGSDNFGTKYLVNDACALLGKPMVLGAVYQFEGQAMVFHPDHGFCYRCIFPDPPPPGTVPTCQEAGVLGAVPGIIGSIQANETLKLLLGAGETLAGRFLVVDAIDLSFMDLDMARNPDCPACGEDQTMTRLAKYESRGPSCAVASTVEAPDGRRRT